MTKREKTPVEFDLWADYYDLLHQGLPGEAEFYVGQAVKRGGPVLELGCGSGRLALPMAMSGVAVTGLDNARAMLDVCREKQALLGALSGSLTLVEGDMRNFDLGIQFPLAVMAYRTFMHCLTPDDQLACLECVYRHLEPGGVLLCNLWAASAPLLIALPPVSVDDEFQRIDRVPIPGAEGITLTHLYRAWRDDFHQLLHERHWVQEIDEEEVLLHEEVLPMTRAWLSCREMGHLVARAGFETEAVLGDFDGTPFGPEHTEMIWHLRHP